MTHILIIYNPTTNKKVWQDEAHNEVYRLAPGEYKAVPAHIVNYFIGLDNEAKERVLFRKGGKSPKIQYCEMEEIANLIAEGMHPVDTMIATEDELENPEVPEIPEYSAFVPGGKYKGELWEQVLARDVFDSEYWKTAIKMLKNIPPDIKDRIRVMVD